MSSVCCVPGTMLDADKHYIIFITSLWSGIIFPFFPRDGSWEIEQWRVVGSGTETHSWEIGKKEEMAEEKEEPSKTSQWRDK